MYEEKIVVTRRGKAVAKSIPADVSHDIEAAQAAALRLRSLAKEMNLGPFDWEEWKQYRDESLLARAAELAGIKRP